MTNIFNIDNNIENFTEKLNIDELYERKRVSDVQKFELYNKLLNRIHVRIKLTSKKTNDKFCWFTIPEIILGVTNFDHAGCISYVIDRLKCNGFFVYYYHPNTLHISWDHWVPKYIRDQIKKKTGMVIDEYGKYVEPKEIQDKPESVKLTFGKDFGKEAGKEKDKKFTPINSYKPIGELIELK